MPKLTAKRLREVLHYDPDTGLFTNKIARGKLKVGDVVGGKNADGYIQIVIDREHHYGHRLAYLWMKGEWPPTLIDHHDTDTSNNRWRNLRLSTKVTNGQNRGRQANNTSGYKGVSWRAERGCYIARIKVAGKVKSLGNYKTAEEAAAAYEAASLMLHGEFGRT